MENKIDKQGIAIKKLGKIVLPKVEKFNKNKVVVLQEEAKKLGFLFSQQAAYSLSNQEDHVIQNIFDELNKLVGNNLLWVPFYKNFPKEVEQLSNLELLFNALLHYWSFGEYIPNYSKEEREKLDEVIKYRSIDLASEDEFNSIYTNILSANSSVTEFDNLVIDWFLNNYVENQLIKITPVKIPFKETLCSFVAKSFKRSYYGAATKSINTTTDVLRIACGLSGGDVSLAEKTKFKLSNKERKFIISVLEKVISEEDVARHQKQWVRLFHCLHVGKFHFAEKCNEIANIARNGKCQSFNAKIEEHILNRDFSLLLQNLSKRGGDFARRLDHVLRTFTKEQDHILLAFDDSIKDVSTRVLIQLGNFYNNRNKGFERLAIPKGSISKAIIIEKDNGKLPNYVVNCILNSISNELLKRFSAKEKLGKVYIDKSLKDVLIPLSMRTASDGLKVLQRGSKMSVGDKNIIRLFTHWVGRDIDLSACFLNEDLTWNSEIAYYDLKNDFAVHSGDITWAPAPNGACEFIDIDLTKIKEGIRYIALDLRVFSGQTFVHQEAKVGWMMRDELGKQKGEIFEPSTVEQLINLTTESRSTVPCLFDVKERKVIWLDLNMSKNDFFVNAVACNRKAIFNLVKAAVNMKQTSLYDLLMLHAKTRGKLVETKEEADVVFDESFAYKHEEILSNYL